ncbi:MAG: hypothetical protein Ct9H300mP16_11380 [Pseudomonadota bacterium]|nr:MAG: hypothetical protein Ct9H300mP16_11380 [Pseudomonadota bacterium]
MVVVGGGPAGLESARVAAARGHRVTLLERGTVLGGAIRTAARAAGWENYLRSVTWLEKQVQDLNVEIQLNTDATAGDVISLEPGAVVIATGAIERRPDLPGVDLDHVYTVGEVLRGQGRLEGRCVVLDETGYTPGPKTADTLAQQGHELEIVTRQYALGDDIGTTVRAVIQSVCYAPVQSSQHCMPRLRSGTPLFAAARPYRRGQGDQGRHGYSVIRRCRAGLALSCVARTEPPIFISLVMLSHPASASRHDGRCPHRKRAITAMTWPDSSSNSNRFLNVRDGSARGISRLRPWSSLFPSMLVQATGPRWWMSTVWPGSTS